VVDNSIRTTGFRCGFFGVSDRFPPVVGRESVRRKRRRLPINQIGPSDNQSAVRSKTIAGTAGAGGQRSGHPKLMSRKARQASRVKVAASDVSAGDERVVARCEASDPSEARAGQ